MFSAILKKLRLGNQLRQEDLASVLSVTAGAVGMWETGKRYPDLEMLCRIADYFNVTTDYLLGRSTDGGTAVANGCNCTAAAGNAKITNPAPGSVDGTEADFLEVYRKLSLRDKARLITQAYTLLDAAENAGERRE